jgi:hypothetical protein
VVNSAGGDCSYYLNNMRRVEIQSKVTNTVDGGMGSAEEDGGIMNTQLELGEGLAGWPLQRAVETSARCLTPSWTLTTTYI